MLCDEALLVFLFCGDEKCEKVMKKTVWCGEAILVPCGAEKGDQNEGVI